MGLQRSSLCCSITLGQANMEPEESSLKRTGGSIQDPLSGSMLVLLECSISDLDPPLCNQKSERPALQECVEGSILKNRSDGVRIVQDPRGEGLARGHVTLHMRGTCR